MKGDPQPQTLTSNPQPLARSPSAPKEISLSPHSLHMIKIIKTDMASGCTERCWDCRKNSDTFTQRLLLETLVSVHI